MTDKQKVEALARQYGCTIEKHIPPARPEAWDIEILPPEGYNFFGLSGLICKDWKDAYERLREVLELGELVEGEIE